MAVTLNATGTLTTSGAGSTSMNYVGITVAAGSNRVLLAFIAFDQLAATLPDPVTASWGGQSMTLIGSKAVTSHAGTLIYMFGLVAPATGNQTLAVAWTNSLFIGCCAVAFNGADQTGGATTFPNSQTSTGTTGATNTVNVTSAVGDVVVGLWNIDSQTFSSVSGTQIYVYAGNPAHTAHWDVGSSSKALTVTPAGPGQPFANVSTDIAAASLSAILMPMICM